MIVLEIEGDKIKAVRLWNDKDIEEAVYTLIQLIPLGCVTTYKDIAKVLGISPRKVAKILSRNSNPIAIPCHRVVKSDGGLGGYTLNGKKVPWFKEKLLKLESLNSELCRYSIEKALLG